MTQREKEILIDCLERRRKQLDTCPPVLPEDLSIVTDLIRRLSALPVHDPKPAARPAAKPKKKPIPVATSSDGTPTVAEAVEQVSRIVEMCEQVAEYDSSDAWDFASSVQEKSEDIARTVEERNYVTPAQAEALDNMESGISRWIR